MDRRKVPIFALLLLFVGIGNCIPVDSLSELIQTGELPNKQSSDEFIEQAEIEEELEIEPEIRNDDTVIVKRHINEEADHIVGYLPNDIDIDGIKLISGNNLLILKNGQLHSLEILNDANDISRYISDNDNEEDDKYNDEDIPEERGLRKRKRFRRRKANDKIRRSRRRNNNNRRRQNTRRKSSVNRNSNRRNNKKRQNRVDQRRKHTRILSNRARQQRRPSKKRRTRKQ